jgi:DNA-directed RNA polymerase specialized sigma24 family protein
MTEEPTDGDVARLTEAYRRYRAALVRRLFRRLGAEQDVTDVCQEVWLRVCRASEMESDRDPLGYFYAVVTQVMWGFFTKRGEERVPVQESIQARDEVEGGVSADEPDTVDQPQFVEWIRASPLHIRRFLERLGSGSREALDG